MQVEAGLWLTKAQQDPSPDRLTVVEWVGFDSAWYQLASDTVIVGQGIDSYYVYQNRPI